MQITDICVDNTLEPRCNEIQGTAQILRQKCYNKVSLFFSLDIPRGNSYQYLGFNLFVIATVKYSIEVLEHGLACRGKREAINSF